MSVCIEWRACSTTKRDARYFLLSSRNIRCDHFKYMKSACKCVRCRNINSAPSPSLSPHTPTHTVDRDREHKRWVRYHDGTHFRMCNSYTRISSHAEDEGVKRIPPPTSQYILKGLYFMGNFFSRIKYFNFHYLLLLRNVSGGHWAMATAHVHEHTHTFTRVVRCAFSGCARARFAFAFSFAAIRFQLGQFCYSFLAHVNVTPARTRTFA